MCSAQQNPPKDCPRDQPGDNSALHSKTSACKNPLGPLMGKGNLLGMRLSATLARSDPKEPKSWFIFFFILPFPSLPDSSLRLLWSARGRPHLCSPSAPT